MKKQNQIFELGVFNRTRGGSEFNRKALEAMFEENPELGTKLFRFMKENSKKSSKKAAGITFEDFLASRNVNCLKLCVKRKYSSSIDWRAREMAPRSIQQARQTSNFGSYLGGKLQTR